MTAHAASGPDRVAYAADDGDVTWRALDECSDRLAGTLIATGAAPGARVGVLLPDGASVHAVYLACEKAGLTIVGIGARAGRREMRHLLDRTGASLLVTAAEFRDEPTPALFAALASEGTALRHHVVLSPCERAPDAPIVVDGAVSDAPPITASARRAGDGTRRSVPRELDVGHDGLPKVVVHTQNRWRYFHQVAVRHGDLRSDDVFRRDPAVRLRDLDRHCHRSGSGRGVSFRPTSPPRAPPRHRAAPSDRALLRQHAVRDDVPDALRPLRPVLLCGMFTGGEAVRTRAEESSSGPGRILQSTGRTKRGCSAARRSTTDGTPARHRGPSSPTCTSGSSTATATSRPATASLQRGPGPASAT